MAKSIGDKIDYGEIMLEVSEQDRAALQELVAKNSFEMPTIKRAVYKNRRSQYKNLLIWCKDNRGVCKIEPLFITNYQYELISVPDLKIQIKKEK